MKLLLNSHIPLIVLYLLTEAPHHVAGAGLLMEIVDVSSNCPLPGPTYLGTFGDPYPIMYDHNQSNLIGSI
jgi:hypothetical protein